MKDKQRLKKVNNVPVVMQMEALECGAASLSMIFAYYGLWVPLEQLREDCGVSRDGSKASNIAKAAMRYNMEVHAYRYELDEVKQANFPAIIYWNFNHFVVLTGFSPSGDYAYINDPAEGRVRITIDEFDKAYTGVIIEMKPKEGFKPSGKPDSTLKFVTDRLHGSKSLIVFAMITFLLSSFAALLNPAFARFFTDEVLDGNKGGMLDELLIVMLIAAVFQMIVGTLHSIYMYKIQGKLAVSSNSSFFWHILHLPMKFFSQRMAGDLAGRQGLNDTVAATVVTKAAPILNDVILLVIYFVVLIRYSALLSLIGIGALLLTLLVAYYISKVMVETQRVAMRDEAKVSSATFSGIDMIETIKVSGAENSYFEKWAGYSASALRARTTQERRTRYLSGMPALIQSISNITILLVGAKLVIDGHFTVGMLTAFQAVLRQFMQPALRLVSVMQSIQQMRTHMERIGDVMNYKEQESSTVSLNPGTEYEKLSGSIEIKNVTFGYPKLEKPLLNDFSLKINPGDKIALIGTSGCGKSTIAKLLSGLYEPWSGDITYDGKSRLEIPKEVFTGSLMVVDQDITLFEDTIYDNIKMWDESISNTDAIAAARDAQIHNDIMLRSKGYDYKLKEGGKDFSGGQRQRIEIARVLAGNPTIAIFDEATSALDAKTEYELTKAVSDRGITCIVVAHRLSTIRDSDLILVLDHGNVVQSGTHDELIKEEGLYRDLITTE